MRLYLHVEGKNSKAVAVKSFILTSHCYEGEGTCTKAPWESL